MKTRESGGSGVPDGPEPPYELRLYVANSSPRSRNALAVTRRMCEERLAGQCRLEVVDIKREPWRAIADQVVAVPALVRMVPQPRKALIGDMADVDATMSRLGLTV